MRYFSPVFWLCLFKNKLLQFFLLAMKPLNYFNAIVFIFGACPMQSVRSSDEAIGCILKTRRNKLKVSRVINLLPNGLTYETFFLVAGIFLTHTGSEKCNTTCKISPTIIKLCFQPSNKVFVSKQPKRQNLVKSFISDHFALY